MSRKRITQIFPFLLPLRKKQRKFCFYLQMRFDGNKYSRIVVDKQLLYMIFETSSLMLNKNSGFDMKFQINKVHNLKLAAKTINGLLIKPKETFSFYQLVRYADHNESFKDGLNLVDGNIVGSYGGGLCQLSNLLFWMFLHTPLTVVERHGHAVQSFPSTTEDLPRGTDATINEGWLDLKMRNDTDATFQIIISFDDEFMYGYILSDSEQEYEYELFNKSISYCKENGKVIQKASVDLNRIDKETLETNEIHLYSNICEIGYSFPAYIEIEEKGE